MLSQKHFNKNKLNEDLKTSTTDLNPSTEREARSSGTKISQGRRVIAMKFGSISPNRQTRNENICANGETAYNYERSTESL
jgi:hypothetical protein